ncbi:MAG: hypothetical protein WCP29_09910 [Acidobacteriota bacterium]
MNTANAFLPSVYSERIQRLVLGIEPTDAQRRARIAHPVQVVVDGPPHLAGETVVSGFDGLPDPIGRLAAIPRHNSCRHALVFPPAVKTPVAIRLFDVQRRFAPRRISYPLPATIETAPPPSRVRRPALFPGAAYDISPTATGLRGRVTWGKPTTGEVPARWVRVTASINGHVVGRAHGDDRGEFVLLLQNEAGGLGDLPSSLVAQVTVFGPGGPQPVLPGDPLGDLPVEILTADPDDVSSGEKLPAGYAATALSARAVTFELGTLLTGQDKFFFHV